MQCTRRTWATRWGVATALVTLAIVAATAATVVVTEDATLQASDAAAGDWFGTGVAIDGDTALVGAAFGDGLVVDSGSAYVFTRTAGVWTQQAELAATDGALVDNFGWTVALSGNTAIVGAQNDDGATGSAYVFTRTGTTWTQQQKLLASDAAAGDQFGTNVSIDGDTAIVGANYDSDAGGRSGSAYVFVRAAGVWTQQAKLTASDAAADDRFGISVSVSGDTAIVGAYLDDDGGDKSGSAYVFTRTAGVWTQQAKLTASDAAALNWFGWSVSVDGDTATVGARGADGAATASGAVYVFSRAGGAWSQSAKLKATDGTSAHAFGAHVALAGDSIVVGDEIDPHAGGSSGSAYLFKRTNGDWCETRKLIWSAAASGNAFGASVAVSGDTVLVGALGAVGGLLNGQGRAFTFDANLLPPAPAPHDGFLRPRLVRAKPTMLVQADLDLGTGSVDLSQPFTLEYGTATLTVPGLSANSRGTLWSHTDGDLRLRISPSRRDDSKALLSLTVRNWSDTLPAVPGGKAFHLGFQRGAFDVVSDVLLVSDMYRAGQQPADKPDLALTRVVATLAGGDDTCALTAEFAGDGTVPVTAPVLHLRVGDPSAPWEAQVPTGCHDVSPTARGWRYSIPDPDGTGPLLAQGAWFVDVDFVKRSMRIFARGVDLGTFPTGSAPFLVSVGFDGIEHGVTSAVDHHGAKLLYR